jgi:hypothetical protein
MDLIEKYLGEAKGDYVKKGIYTQEGRKIQGTRGAKMYIAAVDAEGFVTHLTWKEYKKLNLPTNLNSYIEGEFIKSLTSQLKNFGKKVDFNSFKRGNPSFEDKVDWLLKNGAKYSKAGIKKV